MPRLWSIVFILFIVCSAIASDISGKVIGIVDGDSFTLLLINNTTVRIRLHGIDTPEKGQPFGNNAQQFTSNLIFNKQVKVKQTDTDRYGRIVGIVTNPENIIVNEALLKAGMAWPDIIKSTIVTQIGQRWKRKPELQKLVYGKMLIQFRHGISKISSFYYQKSIKVKCQNTSRPIGKTKRATFCQCISKPYDKKK